MVISQNAADGLSPFKPFRELCQGAKRPWLTALDKGRHQLLCEILFFFLVFLPFLGLLPRHMEVPRLEVESEL